MDAAPRIFAALGPLGQAMGFYTPALHSIPAVAVEITLDQHRDLLAAGERGRLVDGQVILASVPVAIPRRIVIRSAFLGRLSPEERTAVAAASASDLDCAVMMSRLSGWKAVDLDGDDVREVLDAWRAAGAITAARAKAILSVQ